MLSYTFERPPLLNQLINTARTNRYSAATSKKSWTRKCEKAVLEQGLVCFDEKVFILPTITYSTVTTDFDGLDACLKPILDGMVKAGVLQDDNFKFIHAISFKRYIKSRRDNQYVRLDLTENFDEYQAHIQKYLTQYAD